MQNLPLRNIDMVECDYEKKFEGDVWPKIVGKRVILNCGHIVEVNPNYIYLANQPFPCQQCGVMPVSFEERQAMNKMFVDLAELENQL